MRDAAVDLLPGVPSLTGLDAVGVLTGRVFEVTAKHGAMEFSAGRHMQASDVFFRIPDTRPAPVVASQAGAHVQGAADALAELLQRDAIKRYSGFTVDPANVRGQFQGQLTLDLGLGKTVGSEDQRSGSRARCRISSSTNMSPTSALSRALSMSSPFQLAADHRPGDRQRHARQSRSQPRRER